MAPWHIVYFKLKEFEKSFLPKKVIETHEGKDYLKSKNTLFFSVRTFYTVDCLDS